MDLKEYKKKIANLSVNEKKIRDLYLRDLALGKVQGPPTGYAAIDKPWLKYYSEEAILSEAPRMTLLDYLKELNKNNLNMTAISYYGKKVSYGDFFKKVDDVSKALIKFGVKENDRIMYLMPNIPETAYLLYGGSQIGAVSDYVDPRPDSLDLSVSAKKILSLVKDEKIDHLVVLDQCYLGMIKPIENELLDFGIDKIIVVPADSSMNFGSKFNYMLEMFDFNGLEVTKQKIKKMKAMAETMKKAVETSPLKVFMYSDLVESSKKTPLKKVSYIPNKVDVIVHTSGTSGSKPKPIPLTNDNMNSYLHQTFGANMPMNSGDKVLHILPYFAAFGIVDVVHAGLGHSNNLIQVPEFAPINLGKLIMKYKPQTIIGTPTWFLSLLEDVNLKDADLSFLTMVTYGGDSMDKQDEMKVNNFLKNHNSGCLLTKGHGMSEICGCGSFAIDEYNILGSMGIPMPYTIYAIVDPETKEMKPFSSVSDYVEGELIISSDCITPGVLDGTTIVPHICYDDNTYIYTKDIARMDKNGLLTFLSRSDRSFTRFDGYKYKSYEVEDIIKQHERVKYCIISPFYDGDKFGNMPIADIVIKDDNDLSVDEQVQIITDIINNCFINNPNVSSRQMPSKFRFSMELPLTPNGKVDFKTIAAKEITGDEVSVVLEETNISIDNIKIIPPKLGKTKVKTITIAK